VNFIDGHAMIRKILTVSVCVCVCVSHHISYLGFRVAENDRDLFKHSDCEREGNIGHWVDVVPAILFMVPFFILKLWYDSGIKSYRIRGLLS
jgi:hypothetical protein